MAIAAGLAVILLAQFMVRPHIQGIIEVRDTNERNWKKEEGQRKKLQQNLRETEDKLVATEKNLKDTQNKLEVETTRANTQEQLAKQLQEDLTTTRNKLTEANQKLGAWDALGLGIEHVKALIDSEKNLRGINEVLKEENLVLTRVNKRLNQRLIALLGPEADPPLPVGTKGRVLVVDPKWKFVVLDIGEKNDLVENGVLMVSREGKLIAKVRIRTVYADRCIANVMPGWDFGEIMEGDLVLYEK